MTSAETTSLTKRLPAEVLERIFRHLPPPSLKNVLQVCRRWREIGEAPSLWTWVSLPSVTETNLSSAVDMLRCKRLSAATCLEARFVSRELMEAIGDHPGLRGLDVGYSTCGLASFPAPLLAHALTRGLESADLRKTGMYYGQIEALFRALPNTKLKSLNLSWVTSVALLSPELLSSNVALLEKIDLGFIQLSRAQTAALFKTLKQGSSPLKRLNLSQSDLAHLDPTLLAEVVVKLEEVGLENSKLEPAQVVALCQALKQDNCTLKSLELGGNNLSIDIEPSLLASATARLEGVGLSGTRLTTDQLRELLNSLATDSCKVQYISLEKNNLCEVEPELLTAAVVRRTSADLRLANLLSSQISSILAGCTDRNTLQELQLGMVWAEVEDSLLARARAAIPQLEVELNLAAPYIGDWTEETDWFSESE